MSSTATSPARGQFDVIVVGAGFAGLYAVHRLRDEMGLSVQALEMGTDVGGTWYWNRYPGARCDIESVHYSYSFSDDLHKEWTWSERYAAQPEILRYLQYVADRFDLRRSFKFETKVTAMRWDEATSLWHVTTDDGATITARFVVTGVGNVSVAHVPDFPGHEKFKGTVYHTSTWPHEGVDFTGKRVAIIGTGASAIQAIPLIAKEAAHLTIFQRTPNYVGPLRNEPLKTEKMEEARSKYPALRKAARNHYIGVPYEFTAMTADSVPADERKKIYDKAWADGGFHVLMSTFGDILIDKGANETVADYVRDRIREEVEDPKVAEMLCPTDHFYGTKRPTFGTGYYETFNRSNVTLVDLRETPITEFFDGGIRTGDAQYDVDVVVFATGFDAITGPLLKLNITGRNGVTLGERWADGPHSYLGIATHGFPNLFTITGPQSAVALYNNPLAIEDHVEFVSDMIKYMDARGYTTMEANAVAESDWGKFVLDMADQTLFPQTRSWYMGDNVPGKPHVCMIYVGGAPEYRKICTDIAADGYRGFTLASASQAAQRVVAAQ